MGDEKITVGVGRWYLNKDGDEIFILCENPLDVHKFVGLNRRFGHVALWYHDGRGAMGHPHFSPSDLVKELQGKSLLEVLPEVETPTRSVIDTILFDFEHCTLPAEMRKERVAKLRAFIDGLAKPVQYSIDSAPSEGVLEALNNAKPGEIIHVPASETDAMKELEKQSAPPPKAEEKETKYNKPTEGLEGWS